MAENKKGFVLYADQIFCFEELTNEEAGKLIKHIFRYVNDQNPVEENRAVNIAFAPIKQQLKRDLKKYELKKKQWSDAGKASAIKRQRSLTDVESRLTDSTVKDKVIVKDTVTVTVKEKDIIPKNHLERFLSSQTELERAFRYAKGIGLNLTVEQIKIQADVHDAKFIMQFENADFKKWTQYLSYHFDNIKKNQPKFQPERKYKKL